MSVTGSSYVMKPRSATVYVEGSSPIDEMQKVAEREFGRLLGEKFVITEVEAKLDMINVGSGSSNDLIPGQWRVTFDAYEVIR